MEFNFTVGNIGLRGAGCSLREFVLARAKPRRLNMLRENRQFVILSEAKNLSFFCFLVLTIEERFFASLRMTKWILFPQAEARATQI